jgi:hypothetical protein
VEKQAFSRRAVVDRRPAAIGVSARRALRAAAGFVSYQKGE